MAESSLEGAAPGTDTRDKQDRTLTGPVSPSAHARRVCSGNLGCLALPGPQNVERYIVRVHSWWDFRASHPRHTGESRYPGILATLHLYSLPALLDSGAGRNDEFQPSVNINSELLP